MPEMILKTTYEDSIFLKSSPGGRTNPGFWSVRN